MNVVIGNIITLTGSLIMTASGLVKERKKILLSQCLMFLVMGIGMLFLGGVTGACVNFVNIARNLYAVKHELTAKVKTACVVLQAVLTFCLNRSGAFGWLPVISSAVITWMLNSKDEVVLKRTFIVCQVLWAVYDFVIRNYSAFVFDAATVLSTMIGIRRVRKSRKENGETGEQ